MKRLVLLLPLLALAAAPARAEDPATRSQAVETTHADAASVNSPLASALANGDWLPLVVESVSIDRTAPRELRKNWVVSFSGGIKARVHSPVKTFGVSAEELPGERFNVRFADCAAATNALHGTVYTGELEVHPSQNPEIPTTNTPAASESHAAGAENAETQPHAKSAEEEASPEVAKSTNVVFDEIVDGVIAAVDEGREPDLRIPPADEWGNPFSVTNGPDFVKVESFGPDGKRSEDDFLLAVQWGDGFVNVRRVYFDEELKCQGEEEDYYDW